MGNIEGTYTVRAIAGTALLLFLLVLAAWLWFREDESVVVKVDSSAPDSSDVTAEIPLEETATLPGRVVDPARFAPSPDQTSSSSPDSTFALRLSLPPEVPAEYFPDEYRVLLNLRKRGGEPVSRTTAASTAGGAEFSELPYTDAFQLRCQVSCTGRWGALFETFVFEVDRPGEYDCIVPVRSGPFIVGRLIDRMGLPVPRATLEFNKRDEQANEILVYTAAIGQSDEEGGFLLQPSGYGSSPHQSVRGRGILSASLNLPGVNRGVLLGRWIDVQDDWVTDVGDLTAGDGFDVEFRLVHNGILYEGRAEVTLSHGLFSAKVEGTGSSFRMEGVPSLHDTGLFSWYHFYIGFLDLPNANGIGYRQVTVIIKPDELRNLRGPVEVSADQDR